MFTVWGLFPAPFLLTRTVGVSILGPFFVPKMRPGRAPKTVFFHFLCAKKRACAQILARSHRLGRCKTASAASPKGRLGMELRFLFLIMTSVIHNRTCISVSKCKHNLDGHCDETVEPQQTQCKSHIILYAQVCAWQTHSPSSSTHQRIVIDDVINSAHTRA